MDEEAFEGRLVVAKLATLRLGDNQHAPNGAPSQILAADMLSVGRRSVQRAREVIDDGLPELMAAVEQGSVSVSGALRTIGAGSSGNTLGSGGIFPALSRITPASSRIACWPLVME